MNAPVDAGDANGATSSTSVFLDLATRGGQGNRRVGSADSLN